MGGFVGAKDESAFVAVLEVVEVTLDA